MTIDFGTTNSSRYYSTPDNAVFTLPDSDWFWAAAIEVRFDGSEFGYIVSSGAPAAGTFNLWLQRSSGPLSVTCKTGNDAFLNSPTGLATGDRAIVYATRRSNLLYCGFCEDGGTASESSGQAISGSFNSGGNLIIGTRGDLSGTRHYRSGIEWVALNTTEGITAAQAQAIAGGTPLLDSAVGTNVSYALSMSASSATIVDAVAGLTATRNGTSYPADTADFFHPLTAGGGSAVKGVRVIWRDRAGTLYPSRTGLRIRWYDETDQFSWGTAVVNINNGTSAAITAVIEVNLAGSSLNIGQEGSLLIYDEDLGDDRDSKVFHGRMTIIDIQ